MDVLSDSDTEDSELDSAQNTAEYLTSIAKALEHVRSSAAHEKLINEALRKKNRALVLENRRLRALHDESTGTPLKPKNSACFQT
jgi:hypothetical protein